MQAPKRWRQRREWLKALVKCRATATDVHVAHAISEFFFEGVDEREVSQEEVRQISGVSPRQIRRSVSRLVAAGALEVRRPMAARGQLGVNVYRPAWSFPAQTALVAFAGPNAVPFRGEPDEAEPPPDTVAPGLPTPPEATMAAGDPPRPEATVSPGPEATMAAPLSLIRNLPIPISGVPPSRKPLPADPRALPASVIALPAKPGETREPTPDDLRFLAELAARRERMLSKAPASPSSAR